MAKVLLSGGLGYVGAHAAVELLGSGEDIVIADDLSNSSAVVWKQIENITGKRIRFYRVDVADRTAMERIFSENEIGGVIHFAGYKAVAESVRKPLAYYRNNLVSTLNLLESMAAHQVTRFVFSSSATVYGTENPVPLREDMPTGTCASPYGWTKYMAEQILRDAAGADPELSVVLLRYFNPIGAHESGLIGEWPNGVPNNLMPRMTQAAAGLREKLPVFGNDYPTPDGTGVRDYIHVVDLAKGHVAALHYTAAHKGVEDFNLGTGTGYSVLQLLRTFEAVNGIRVPYEVVPRRQGDLAVCYADVQKAQRVLGWRAEKTLEDMCRDAWRWQCTCRRIYGGDACREQGEDRKK